MLVFADKEQALFIGVEQEGINKGTETLFVVNEVPTSEIRRSHAHENLCNGKIKQVYLGAGFLSRVSRAYINKVVAYLDKFQIPATLTIEACYVDLAFMVSMDRMPTWIYTPMMKGFVVPDYEEVLETLANSNSRLSIAEISCRVNVYIKFDMYESVLIVPLTEVIFNKYGTYGEDRVILSDTFSAEAKRPSLEYPGDRRALDAPKVFRSLTT